MISARSSFVMVHSSFYDAAPDETGAADIRI